MLSDDNFKEFHTSQIEFFFEINKTPDVSQSTGQTISYVSHTKKLEAIKLSVISEEILQLDNQYAVAPTPALYNRRLHLQAEFDVLSTSKAELLLLKSRQRIFETGTKQVDFSPIKLAQLQLLGWSLK